MTEEAGKPLCDYCGKEAVAAWVGESITEVCAEHIDEPEPPKK